MPHPSPAHLRLVCLVRRRPPCYRSKVKQLVAPGVVQISASSSGRRRTTSTGLRPPCFVQIWRSCSGDTCYLEFSDGSIYLYDSPAAAVAAQIVNADVHGIVFNRGVRRSIGLGGAYARVGAVPGSATLVYALPPYEPAATLGPCPVGPDWPSAVWARFPAALPSGSFSFSPANGAMGDTLNAVFNSGPSPTFCEAGTDARVNYAGPAANSQLTVDFAFTGTISTWSTFRFVGTTTGHTSLLIDLKVSGPGHFVIPFPIVDTHGVLSTQRWVLDASRHTPSTPFDFTLNATMINV